MTHSLRILAIVLLTLGCGAGGPVGSGTLTTQTREVPAFKTVSVSGGLKVELKSGPRAVSVTTDENLVDGVITEVIDGALIVRLKQLPGYPTSLLVTVTNDVLEGVDLSGGSKLTGGPAGSSTELIINASGGSSAEVSGIIGKSVIANASGGSDITLTDGTCTRLVIAASGGSKFSSHGFIAEDVTVEASGGSEVCVTATKSITGGVSGGSTLTLTGSPAIKAVQSSGGSRLIEQN